MSAAGGMHGRVEREAPEPHDHVIKLLLVGDSGVGKSSLLVRFTDDVFEVQSPTIGVDFKLKYLNARGKRLKLTVWDTAGQERFRTLTSSYYRGAQGIVFVYDITKRESFENVSEIWAKEVDLYATVEDCVKIVIGNKIDKEKAREVSRKEGEAFAEDNGCLFLETSAKSRRNVKEAFDELVSRVLDTPSLLTEHDPGGGGRVRLNRLVDSARSGCACL